MKYAPIVLFAYNRLEHLKRTVESLSRNLLATESSLFIYSDAAKDDSDQEEVSRVRDFIHTIAGFKEVTIIEREKNQALARNVIDGVTTLVEEYGTVIVLEDDLVLSPYFLQFMNDALKMYENESGVGHIHACEFFDDGSLPDTFLIKWTGSWGWATWKRAWKLFNPNGKELLKELEERNLSDIFDFNKSYRYTRMLKQQTEGLNNSWAIRWNASLFLKGILSLNVGKSLVQNIGFDGSGTHCGDDELYYSSLYANRLSVNKIEPVEENIHARKVIESYYKRTQSFKAKFIRRIKKEIRKL